MNAITKRQLVVSFILFLILARTNFVLTFFLNDMLEAYRGISVPGGDVAEPWTSLLLSIVFFVAFIGFFFGHWGWVGRNDQDQRKRYLILIIGSLLPAYLISASWVHEALPVNWAYEIEIDEKMSAWTIEISKHAERYGQVILFAAFAFQASIGIWVDAMTKAFGKGGEY